MLEKSKVSITNHSNLHQEYMCSITIERSYHNPYGPSFFYCEFDTINRRVYSIEGRKIASTSDKVLDLSLPAIYRESGEFV